MAETTEPDANGGAGGANGDGNGAGEDPGPKPYERAQARLRVDGVAYGKAVEALREERGWSVRELSKRSGIPLTTVAKLLRGETEAPDAEVACALSYTFGFPNPGALLGRPGTRSGEHHDRANGGPGPMSLDKLIESLLRGVWAAQGTRAALSPEAVELSRASSEAEGQALPDLGAVLPRRALAGPLGGGVALYVNLLVLVDPRLAG